ncbi:MAG: hypothetical protein ACI4S1_05715, partial [Roseburia sp.]
MNKKEQVIKVLLTPINVTGYSGKDGVSIKKTENCIETTQTYYPYKSYDINIDPDMLSDGTLWEVQTALYFRWT